jgi:hypothetical protein
MRPRPLLEWPHERPSEKFRVTTMRLRFTVRDLLWLTVVVALFAGYWHERSRHEPKQYDVDLSDDGTTLRIVNNESGVVLSMPSSGLDKHKILQDLAPRHEPRP